MALFATCLEMVLIFPYCHRSSTLRVDQVLLLLSCMTISVRCRCSRLLILSISCLYHFLQLVVYAHQFCLPGDMPTLFISYLSRSRHLFFFFFFIKSETMGNLTQGRQSIVYGLICTISISEPEYIVNMKFKSTIHENP